MTACVGVIGRVACGCRAAGYSDFKYCARSAIC